MKTASYIGSKWGGKYLRAPEVYHTILAKGRDAFILLGQICDVNEGRPTGANDFFYPTNDVVKEFQIESRYLHPGLMKTRGANRFVIRRRDLDRSFLAVQDSKTRLRGTNVLEYVLHGEALGLNKRGTFANKPNWYVFTARRPADLVLPCGIGATYFCAVNRAEAVASNSFTELRLHNAPHDLIPVWTWMNSAVGWLYGELMGRSTLGGGMLKIDPCDYRRMPLLRAERLPSDAPKLDRAVDIVATEVRAEDRRLLDGLIFDSLGLTKGECEGVYEAVISLVESRLKKAGSV